MEAYKHGGRTVWDCKYHLVWVTKYRYSALGGDVGVLRETARAHEMAVDAGSINRDHAYMLLSIAPSLSASRAVQHLQGRSSHKLLSEFGLLASAIGASISGRGAIGWRAAATLRMKWDDYIRKQTPPEPMTTSMSRELPPCPPNGGPIRALSRNPKPPL
jgi:putative transposase